MDEWVKDILEKQRKMRKEPLEVKNQGDKYYLYKSTTKWNKVEKRRQKISIYIGKITKDGLREKKKLHPQVRTVFEYGNGQLLLELSKEILAPLKDSFPLEYQEILAMAYVKTLHPTPIKMIKTRWEKLHISKEFEASLSPNILSEKLRVIGSDWYSQRKFFEYLIIDSKKLIFDLSTIFSYSENLKFA